VAFEARRHVLLPVRQHGSLHTFTVWRSHGRECPLRDNNNVQNLVAVAGLLLGAALPVVAHDEKAAAGMEHHADAAVRLSDRQVEAGKFSVAEVSAGVLRKRIVVPGSIVPSGDHIARVAVRLLGTVAELRKRLGDSVQAGEVVAVIESREVADAKSEYLAAVFDLQQTLFDRSKMLFERKFLSENDFLRAPRRTRLTRRT
jgi:membrane fusion protein, heavy metal efflux system